MSIYGTYLQESYNKKESVNESIILTALAAFGLFVIANIAALAIKVKLSLNYINKSTKEQKEILDKIESDPKLKALLEKVIKNLGKFFISNVPGNLKKYFSTMDNIKISTSYVEKERSKKKEKNKSESKEKLTKEFVKFNIPDLFKDTYHKSLEDYFKDQLPDDIEDKDDELHYSDGENIDKFPELKAKIKIINDTIDKINSKTSSAIKHCVIKIHKIECKGLYLYPFDEYEYIDMEIKTTDFSNIKLSEDEEKEVEKLLGDKIDK